MTGALLVIGLLLLAFMACCMLRDVLASFRLRLPRVSIKLRRD